MLDITVTYILSSIAQDLLHNTGNTAIPNYLIIPPTHPLTGIYTPVLDVANIVDLVFHILILD